MKDNKIEIFIKGIENKKQVAPTAISSKIRSIKLLLFYLIAMLFSPKTALPSDVFLVYGVRTFIDISIENIFCIYRGRFASDMFKVYKSPTIFAPFNLKERIKIWRKAKKEFKANNDVICDFAAWLEFSVICELFDKCNISKFYTRSHYDDVTTWLGELSKEKGFKLVMFQHGVVDSNLKLNNKIHFDEINVFDNYSKKCFSENCVENSDCNYVFYDFKPSCAMRLFDKGNTLLIGIAEQCNEAWCKSIIDSINKEKIECTIIVMLHPNSNYVYQGDNIISTTKKYSNIDYLLTENSTLAIDYYRANKQTKIIYTKPVKAFAEYPFAFIDSKAIAETLKATEEV